MPCSVCGEICSCPSEPSGPEPRELTPAADAVEWRNEIADRLHRYQARRKPRPPRYPSLRLKFEEENYAAGTNNGVPTTAGSNTTGSNIAVPTYDLAQPRVAPLPATIGARALAISEDLDFSPLERAHGTPTAAAAGKEKSQPLFPALDREQSQGEQLENEQTDVPGSINASASHNTAGYNTARIIEFPRSWTPAPASPDELAGPVIDKPRILDVPEVSPPPPALGGITIEPAAALETGKRPGIDAPLEPAHALRRALATVLDAFLIASACALFAFVFSKMTDIRPPKLQILGLGAGLAAVFWAAYQYLLIVYSGATPGLRLAGLRLARFDGRPANRRLRRWRVLASFLSAASLGMGYAWVFLDEDALCWHDRITRTSLASKCPPAPSAE